MKPKVVQPWAYAILAAMIVVVAAVGVYLVEPRPTVAPNDPNAISFFSAFRAGEAALSNSSHSAWSLVAVMGIASAHPVNPPIGLGDQRSCASLASPTVWNTSSLPTVTGVALPGTTPFWQFTFLNRTSRAWIMVTVVDRHAHVLGPIAPWAPCSQVYGVNNTTNLAGYPSISPRIDTTTVAPLAWSAVGASFMAAHPMSAVYYTMGNQPLGIFGWNAVDWIAAFTECGVSGAPVQIPAPLDSVSVNASSGQLGFTFSGGFGCMGESYELNLTAMPSPVPTVSLSVCSPGSNASLPPICGSPSALASGSIEPMITNTSAGLIAPTRSLCAVWTANVSACPEPTKGWYLVLTTPTGLWLDSYPGASGSGWVAPNVDVESGDELVVLFAPGTQLSSATITIQGTMITPSVGSNSIVL